jgi:hypothetical protein
VQTAINRLDALTDCGANTVRTGINAADGKGVGIALAVAGE